MKHLLTSLVALPTILFLTATTVNAQLLPTAQSSKTTNISKGILAPAGTNDASLVAYYMMDEGSGTALLDASGTGNNGTIFNGPLWVPGMKGLAIDFNGNKQYATVPTAASLNITSAITLSAWFLCETTAVARQEIISKDVQGTTDGYELYLSNTQNVIFRLNQKTSGSTYQVTSATKYPLNGSAWMHAAATYDGSTMKLYINGVQEGGSVTGPAAIATNSLPLAIAEEAGVQMRYKGKLDEVRLYNRALSQTEVQALMNHTITATADAGGTITPSGAVSVAHNGSQTFTIAANSGFAVSDVTVNGITKGAITSYTFSNVIGDSTIHATFVSTGVNHTITAGADPNGTIDPSGAVIVADAGNKTFTITPNTGYHVADLHVDGGSVGPQTTYTFYDVTTDHTINASFAINAYTLTITVLGGGGVAKAPDQPTYNHGTSVQLTATPLAGGWIFSGWRGDTSGLTNPLSVPMNSNRNITATFSNPNTLVGYWAMEQGGGTTLLDSSTFVNNGAILGNPSWVPGIKGQALSFNGTNQYAAVPDTPSLHIWSAITLAAWIAPTQGGVQQRIISKEVQGVTDGFELSLSYDGHVFFRVNQTQNGGVGWKLQSTTLYPTNGTNWIHTAGVYDGTTLHLYINGIEESTWPGVSMTIGTNTDSLYIARQKDGQYNYQGKIDEVRVYSRALSLAEVQALAGHTITATAGANGSISPSGAVSVPEGGSQTFTITPSYGYRIDGVTINGVNRDAMSSYTFTNVMGDSTISATFASISPDSPILISPSNGSSGVPRPPTLGVSVHHPDGIPVTATFYGKLHAVSNGENFTIIDLPDAQNYTANLNGGSNATFRAQTEWIVHQRAIRNIVYVTQTGDITEDGDNSPIEWYRADTSMRILEDPVTSGLPEGIPYGVCVGNHDQTPNGDPNGTTTYYNQYFGAAHFAGISYYGGHYGSNNNNSFQLFSASGMDFIVVNLEYNPSPSTALLHWTDSLLKTYSNRRAIVCTHYLIDGGNPGPLSSQGSLIYDALKDNPNLFLMLGGHTGPEGRRTDTYDGHTVYSVLADYEGSPNGGNGWLRIFEFSPSTSEINVKTYSPTLDQFETTSDGQFTLSYPMDGSGYQVIGTNADVPSGSNTSIAWLGLDPLAQYDWYVTLDDGQYVTTGPAWTFTTKDTEYTITASAGANGTISPVGPISVYRGANQGFVITPNTYYHLDSLLVDEIVTDSTTSFTFKNVNSVHTIRAVFAGTPETMSTSALAGWNLVSVPARQTDMSPGGVFDDDYGETPYFMYQYNSASGYSIPSMLNMGQGYWLGSNTAQTVDARGVPISSYTLTLTNGWNLIGNPFVTDEPVSNLKFTDGSVTLTWTDASSNTYQWLSPALYGYAGGGYFDEGSVPGGALHVWNGYWIPIEKDGISLMYSVGTPAPKQGIPVAEQITSKHWSVDLAASLKTPDGKTCTDEIASFGVRNDAMAGFDNRYDVPRPPKSPGKNYIEVSFTVNGESYPKIFGISYARDYKAPGKAVWEFIVNTSGEGIVTLTWNSCAVSSLGNDVEINMYDMEAHKSIDMKKVGSYTYEEMGTGRRFTINNADKVAPSSFRLSQNYPNPFNPTTVIEYQLPKAMHVQLEVYNVLGERIATLVNEQQDAGYYTVSWDGRDQQHRMVTSGIYFYRLDAGQLFNMKKMLLMK